MVPGIDGDSVPLLRSDRELYTWFTEGPLTVRIDTSVDLRASAVYLNAMVWYCPSDMPDTALIRATLYFSDSAGTKTHAKDLRYRFDIRNWSAVDYLNAMADTCPSGGDSVVVTPEPGSGNTVEIAAIEDSSQDSAFSDLIRIPVLSEHRPMRLDSLQFDVLHPDFGVEAPCEGMNGVYHRGMLFLPAITVKRALEE